MFYNVDILSRRRHGFGIYWLAATLGSRGGVASKKLTRKEVMSCNLVIACQKLATPDEPLALRLQSNLLCGIARVYQQQWTIYSGEVIHFHQHLRKAFSEALKRDTEANDQQLAPPQVATHTARNQITLGWDPALAVLGWDAEYEQMIDWSETAARIGVGEDIEELSSGLQIEKDADVSRITLREPHLEQYRAEDVPAYGFDEGLGADFEFGEGELGLLEGQFPELDAQIRAASLRSRSAAASLRGADWTSSVGGILPDVEDMGGFEQDEYYSFTMEFGGEGYGAPEVPGGLPGVENVSRFLFATCRCDLWSKMSSSYSIQEPLPPGAEEPSRQPEDGEMVPEAVRAALVARQVAKKPRRGLIDSSTALDDNTIREMRSSYADRMKEERVRAEVQREAREAVKAGMDALFRPPPGFEGGPLGDFWHSTVTDSLVPLGGGQASVDRQARVPGTPPTVEEARAAAARMRVSSVEFGRPFERGFSPALEFGGEGYMGPDFEDMGGLDIAAEYFPEPEVGRAASHRESVVPWHAEDVTSDVGAPDYERAPSALGRVSLETPVRARARTASLLGRSRPPSVLQPEVAKVAKSKTTTSDLGVPQELESLKFLAYARRVQPTVAEEDGTFRFVDLVPRYQSGKSVAAIGFYHLLVLATKEEIDVVQAESFAEVRVEVVLGVESTS
ncbi:BZ3500_MvSof-1268-A1-R1_Chr2-2g04754 [Microbotryum saponariae]|uniref:BZ3500_MvSof-1268-A1-R1_Chr2-2g04754 protein n=1 Tax=Microbotryum saponariae TaxID=289078 RepID=A0A2X0K7P7_9BASI|nr:BZ3500_MvSof-1268-A1-R1_Chr2-2g04754 [Microbotryum saponariae]SDA00076.1 BZ3501_MvSof-1269-A2-R1_Chr2-2g04428 [Microbotryum saponariae]